MGKAGEPEQSKLVLLHSNLYLNWHIMFVTSLQCKNPTREQINSYRQTMLLCKLHQL